MNVHFCRSSWWTLRFPAFVLLLLLFCDGLNRMTWVWDVCDELWQNRQMEAEPSCLIRTTSGLLVCCGLIRRVHQMQTAPWPSSSSPPSASSSSFQHTEVSDSECVKWLQCSCNFEPEVQYRFDLSFPSVWNWSDVISGGGRGVLWCPVILM